MKRNHLGYRVGEYHHRAKLSDEMVRAIRDKYADAKASGKKKGYGWVAARFGVSEWTVRDLVTFRTRASA